ncbi:hypothetical protein AVEN_246438-1 [Araneus ventricosus]|uniref:Tc1-like transposase DDE domain-containing protein n=1 Tax=Araneus ventricosus TaxID=182803 RepID=A0A4Y2X8J5_ARAVE|nr:hypothetical protein AVEN_246438-1 [Araneus ventricosus]
MSAGRAVPLQSRSGGMGLKIVAARSQGFRSQQKILISIAAGLFTEEVSCSNDQRVCWRPQHSGETSVNDRKVKGSGLDRDLSTVPTGSCNCVCVLEKLTIEKEFFFLSHTSWGPICHRARWQPHQSATAESNADAVQQVILQQPQTSVRLVASRARLRRMTTHHIMRHNLHMFPYKIQTRQPLSVNAIDARYDFANTMLQLVNEGDIDVGNIWFSEEAYFNLDGFVNKQNWCIWGTENPHLTVPSSLCSPKVMVWTAISSKGIIGTFFQEQTINAAKYLGILDEFVAIHYALDDHWNASWFIQDSARRHRTPAVFDFLSEHFNDRVIALDYDKHTRSGMAWPPYSPDLTPCELERHFFFGGT